MTATIESEKLAIDGGPAVRTEPLPWELPGAHWIGSEEEELVTQVVRAKSPFRYYGLDLQHMVDQLEDEFRGFFGRKYALAVSSATSGLHIALTGLGIGPGDEVLLPGYLWCSCIGAIVRAGAIPRLVDIDDTFCMDPEDLRRKITPHSRAVLLVHMSGAPGRVRECVDVARSAGLKVIEDCAQSIGARSDGKLTGTFGDLAVFSFQLNKNMSSGEGGLLLCDDANLYSRCFAIHDLGYARNEAGRLDPGDERYQLWGVGSRMSELAGALALAQFRKLSKITEAMRSAKWAIRRQIADLPGIAFRNILHPAGDSGPFLITLYRTAEIARRFTAALRAEGIRGPEGSTACITMEEWGLHWYFNNQSLVHRRSLSRDGWPWTHPSNSFASSYSYGRGLLRRCDDFCALGALLAIASVLTPTDIDQIVRAFRKVAQAGLAE
jgi:8-amino-3,8-dideoxy-alpha-D-manno-octulosonate transaminase